MYGAGMRLMEVCRLRVKDLDFPRLQITVRDGKREKDRIAILNVQRDNRELRRQLQDALERVDRLAEENAGPKNWLEQLEREAVRELRPRLPPSE